MPADTSSDLEQLLKAWGVDYRRRPRSSADPAAGAAGAVSQSAGGEQVVDYLPWLSLADASAGSDDVDHRRAQPDQRRPRRAAWQPPRAPRTSFTPLITLERRGRGDRRRQGAACSRTRWRLLRDYKPGGEPLVMAAQVTGPVKSAYPDALPEGVEPRATVA